MNQLIRLANGQLGILLNQTEEESKFSVPQANQTIIEVTLANEKINMKKPLWEEIVPIEKMQRWIAP